MEENGSIDHNQDCDAKSECNLSLCHEVAGEEGIEGEKEPSHNRERL